MNTHSVDYLKQRKETSENKKLFLWQYGLPNDTPLNVRLWVYVNGFSGGCYRSTASIAKDLGTSYNHAYRIIHRYLKSGEMAYQDVKGPGGQSMTALVCVVPTLAKDAAAAPESWMDADTSPAPAPQQPPQRQEVPPQPAATPATATKSTLSRWLDTAVESTTRRCLTAKRGTLIGALPEHSRVSTLAKALRKVPYIADVYELASEPTATALPAPVEAVFTQVLEDAIAHLCGLSGEGANNPAAVLMKNASEFLVDEQAAARKVTTASTPAEPVLPFDPAFQGSDLLAAGADVERKFVVQHRAQRVVLFQMLTASELAECRAQADARRARQFGGPARWQLGQSEVFRLLARLRDGGDARLKTFSQCVKDADFQDCR